MASYKTQGIIIKRTNLGEADRILTILTEKHGKIKAIAKGVRKTLSRLGGNLEPFCITNMTISEGRNLDIVTEAEISECFINLRGNLQATNISYYLAEIIDAMTVEKEKHPQIYHLLTEILRSLDHDKNKLLQAYFEINFLAESGFLPELYKCTTCERKICEGKNFFNFTNGGLVCSSCKGGQLSISDKAIKVLRLFLKHKIGIIDKINMDKKLTQEIEKIASLCLTNIAQKEFKAKRFLILH